MLTKSEYQSLEVGDDLYIEHDKLEKLTGMPSLLPLRFIRCIVTHIHETMSYEHDPWLGLKVSDKHLISDEIVVAKLQFYVSSRYLHLDLDIFMTKGINDLKHGDIVYISAYTFSECTGIKAGFSVSDLTEKVECRVENAVYRTDLVDITITDRNFTSTDHTIRINFNKLIIP